MMHVGGYLEHHGDVQYLGGYHDKCGGCLEYRGGVQYHGGYHEYRGGYLEYRGGDHDERGGYHEYRGGGGNLLLFEYAHGTHDIPQRAS